MSAPEHLSPQFRSSSPEWAAPFPPHTEQLKMLMSAREIREDGYIPNEDEPDEKIMESEFTGLRDSIAKEGVHYPVSLSHRDGRQTLGRMIINGHHRFFTQEDVDEDRLMPVQHFSDRQFGDSFKTEKRASEERPDLPGGHTYGKPRTPDSWEEGDVGFLSRESGDSSTSYNAQGIRQVGGGHGFWGERKEGR